MSDIPADDLPLIIDWVGGKCPVQSEGLIDGQPYYFRARGDSWSMSIGGDDVVGNPDWYHEEDFGEWPDAGWMTEDDARGFIRKAAALYMARESADDGQPDEQQEWRDYDADC